MASGGCHTASTTAALQVFHSAGPHSVKACSGACGCACGSMVFPAEGDLCFCDTAQDRWRLARVTGVQQPQDRCATVSVQLIGNDANVCHPQGLLHDVPVTQIVPAQGDHNGHQENDLMALDAWEEWLVLQQIRVTACMHMSVCSTR